MSRRLIAVVEDDYFDMELTIDLLAKHFGSYGTMKFATEEEFRRSVHGFNADPPVLVLMGMRMKWADPAPEMPAPPQDVLAGTYREAGARCWRALRTNNGTKNVPVIFYTTIDERNNVNLEILRDPMTTFIEKDITDKKILAAISETLALLQNS